MSLYQYLGQSYPVLISSTYDFVIPPGETEFFSISANAVRVWDSVYVTPESILVDFFPAEVVAQVFGDKFYVPTFNSMTEPQTIRRGTVVCKISPVLNIWGPIAYYFKPART